MSILTKEQIRELIKEYNVKDAKDIHNMLKDLFGETIQEMLEAELDNQLGYSKYDYKNKKTDNSRNGYSKKIIRTDMGTLRLMFPETVMENLSHQSSRNINVMFPVLKAEVQKCIVHQIRNTMKYVPRKERVEFLADLRSIYQAPTEIEGLRCLDILEEKWADR